MRRGGGAGPRSGRRCAGPGRSPAMGVLSEVVGNWERGYDGVMRAIQESARPPSCESDPHRWEVEASLSADLPGAGREVRIEIGWSCPSCGWRGRATEAVQSVLPGGKVFLPSRGQIRDMIIRVLNSIRSGGTPASCSEARRLLIADGVMSE